MDDELDQFEAELKNLRPAPLSSRLVARVEREMARGSPASQSRGQWLGWLALPAAAGVALLLLLFSQDRVVQREQRVDPPALVVQPPAPATETLFKPITAEKLLVSADDEGLVTLEDGTPARRERLHYVDTITWRNVRTNASLKWSVPREEVRVVPVAFQ